MPIETTIEGIRFGLANPPARKTSVLVDWIHQGWILTKLVLTGLLLWQLASWAHDFERTLRLEAEPTPPFKVITKNEAWQRVYNPSAPIHAAIADPAILEGIVKLQ